jgi:hypothetical protein
MKSGKESRFFFFLYLFAFRHLNPTKSFADFTATVSTCKTFLVVIYS